MTKTHQEFITQFGDERKPLVEALLNAIKEACPTLTETIKWNAPTFCDNGKYRMAIILHKKDRVGLILHTGAKPKEAFSSKPCSVGLKRQTRLICLIDKYFLWNYNLFSSHFLSE